MSDSTDVNACHEKVLELLPWVINGRASVAERSMVEMHLRECADCRTEYQFQSALFAEMSNGPVLEPDAARGLERLWERIDQAAGAAIPGLPS
ncbi:Putative zinc-finger [Collimonas sp. OK242]|uniref:zf-HC2 domain-containing protein n=1 Tax=Collimonas sp. OK242 TaxID=1798195 RepID=UPI0008958498|nr:zf-HC2 domain-containing protein [Collimonas sp. OK242]SDX06301.1 Putative zinc-finger [Collimonas sp. OK242]